MKIKITPSSILIIITLGIILLIGFIILFSIWIKSLDTFWAVFVFCFVIIASFAYDLRNKKLQSNKNNQFLDNAKKILGYYSLEFDEFYHLYFDNSKNFFLENKKLLEENDNFDLKKLKPIEILYLFLHSRKLVNVTDWKGEENDFEIETFIETFTKNINWKNTTTFRNANNKGLKDSNFVPDLLKVIDKDLSNINYRLVFLDLTGMLMYTHV